MPDYPSPSLDPLSLPFSMEAEQAVLGSVLIDPACMSLVQVVLRPEHFYLPQHQSIFGVMMEIEAVGGKIDPLLVLDRLKRDEIYDETGGRNYLFQMAQAVPSTANVESYARIVREKFYLRTLITVSQEIIQSAGAEAETADTLLDAAEQKIYDIRQGRMQSGASKLRDIIVNDVYDTLAKLTSPDKVDLTAALSVDRTMKRYHLRTLLPVEYGYASARAAAGSDSDLRPARSCGTLITTLCRLAEIGRAHV